PNYTSLSDEAHAAWIRLQAESRQTVLTETPVLEAGLPGSAMVASSRAAAIAKGRHDPMLTATVANKEFPAFTLPDDWDVVVQDGGAILWTGVVMRLMRSRAGNRVIPERASFTPHHDGVSIRTVTGRHVDPNRRLGFLDLGSQQRGRNGQSWLDSSWPRSFLLAAYRLRADGADVLQQPQRPRRCRRSVPWAGRRG
ncbi:hypothetical protein ACFQX9_16455, partial [Bradyrhizobium sp. GCM10028915]